MNKDLLFITPVNSWEVEMESFATQITIQSYRKLTENP